MRFSLMTKIWVAMFSILCMLSSSFAYSISVMPMQQHKTQQVTQQQHHCEMMRMHQELHSHHVMTVAMQKEQHKHHVMTVDMNMDCESAVDNMSSCCSSNCTMASAMILPSMLDLSVSVTNSPQLSSLILAEVNHPSSSLFRPPIL